MKYINYLLNDFVTDDYFLRWVKKPDNENNKFWQDWIAQNPEKKDLMEEARLVIIFLNNQINEPSSEDYNEVKSNIFKLIHETDGEPNFTPNIVEPEYNIKPQFNNSPERSSDFNSAKKYYFRAAAIFAGLLMISAVSIFVIQLNQTTKYATVFGETKSIDLPDGSSVVLNSNSTLKVSKNWENNNIREVWLDGEAFFNVVKKDLPGQTDANQTDQYVKFIVNVNNLKVEVIGTMFNVNSRRGLVKVVLNSGKVNLNTGRENMEMNPGDMVEFSPSKETFSKKTVEADKITSWRNQKFIFEESSLKEIAQVIEDNYGYEVKFQDQALANRNFTGSIPYQNVDLFLTVLAESFNLIITKNQDTIMMKNNY
ncbi:hypothetical protein BH23BAC1_BH23BAC1_15720 [soil metagenome]